MVRKVLPIVLAVVALGLVSFSGAAAQTIGPSVSISIVDAPRPESKWGYAPTSRKIPAGTWVTWTNNGQDAHTVTANDGSFDSGDLDPSDGFSWYFDTPGTYTYTCAEHPWMTGTIVVGSGQPAADANATPADNTSPDGQG